MDKFEVPIQDLVLDLKNPRLVEADTQLEALQALIKIGPTYFRNLMRSIKDNGLDPGDSFYVLEDPEEDGLFVVVDGNRRLAALTVLNEPSVLRGIELGDADLRLLTKAAEGYVPGTIVDVDCVLFEQRADADRWIERRHGNDLAGEGRLVWGPLEIERFQRDHTNLDVIDFVGRNTAWSDGEWTVVKASVEKNSSLLNRLLTNKAFRRMIGLTVTTETDDSKLPYFSSSPENVLGVMEKVFRDISEKRINSRSLNNAEEIEAYVEHLPAELKEAPKPNATPQRFRDVSIAKPEPVKAKAQPAGKPTKTSKATRPRQSLAEAKHPFKQPDTTKGQRLVFEASKLNPNNFPLASAYTLRSFLEHTIDGYMLEHNMPRQDGRGKQYELARRAENVIEHLVQSGRATGTELRRAKSILTDTKSPSSIQALNDYHHARYVIPAADTLRTTWDACIPLFQAVYGRPE